MLKIIHISDLHVGAGSVWASERANTIAIMEYILQRFSAKDTIIVNTGDFVNSGHPEEYRICKLLAMDPLQLFTVLTCPGNHDYNLTGLKYSVEAVTDFRKCINPNPFYPQVHVLAEEKTVLIGLDSADPANKARLGRGFVGEEQLAKLEGLLTQYKGYFRVVYFHHHPFIWRFSVGFFGKAPLLKILAAHKADLVLFGHRHWSQALFDHKGIPVMLASGKVTKPNERNNLAFRVVEIGNGKIYRVYEEEIRAAK